MLDEPPAQQLSHLLPFPQRAFCTMLTHLHPSVQCPTHIGATLRFLLDIRIYVPYKHSHYWCPTPSLSHPFPIWTDTSFSLHQRDTNGCSACRRLVCVICNIYYWCCITPLLWQHQLLFAEQLTKPSTALIPSLDLDGLGRRVHLELLGPFGAIVWTAQ